MDKVIGKKFLSCLCAFASSISMSFAVVDNNEYCAPIVPFSVAPINVKTSTKKVIEKLSNLNPGDCNLSHCDAGAVRCALGTELVTENDVRYFRFSLFSNKEEGVAIDENNNVCIMKVDVYAGYVVERLGIAEKDVPDNGSLQDFIDAGKNKFKFSRLFLEDVLGIKLDEGYYSSASTGAPYNPNNNNKMTKKLHPDHNGCFWRYFKKNIYDVFTKNDVNLLGKVLSDNDVNNGVQFEGVDQKGIYEYFFGTPKKSKMTNYYKAMVNVRWSAGAKAGVIVPTLLFLGSVGLYAGEKILIEPMKDRALSASFASLKNENRRLKIDADRVHIFEAICGKTGAGREIKKQVERRFKQNSTKVRRKGCFVPSSGSSRVRRSRSL